MRSLFVLFVVFIQFTVSAVERNSVAISAEHVSPILNGQFVPDVVLKTEFGKPIRLVDLVESKPSVILFYRGGWCPYCNRQMAGLLEVEQRIIDLGYQIIAISPDSPTKVSAQQTNTEFNIVRLSDDELKASVAFGLAYFVAENAASLYRLEAGAKLQSPAGDARPVLPVPAAFVTDTTGLVKFQYVNPNYKVRVEPQLLYYAARLAK